MPKLSLPAIAAALTLAVTSSAFAMGGGGVGAGGGGFGLPLWQPPGVYGPAPDGSGYRPRHHVRRAYGSVGAAHHHRRWPQ